MTQHIMIEATDEVEAKLNSLPTATTFSERQLALYYLAEYWDGTGDVFENGPLLGGATRALGMGMRLCERRDPDALLWTFDWFSLAQPLDLPDDAFLQLVWRGDLTTEEVNAAYAAGTFLPIFEALHRDEDYWPLVRARVGYLPGHRDDEGPLEGPRTRFVAPDREFSVAFVDGCKSWYGTKYWFRELAPKLRPGADVLFQDFGHYTCFWLPMLVGRFRERFELRAYVDHTYVWRVLDPPTVEEIESVFPDEPTDLTAEAFDESLGALYLEAMERGDRYGVLAIQMQRAASRAYLGLLDESREILDTLLSQSEWLPLRPYLKAARVSPAYTPEARIFL